MMIISMIIVLKKEINIILFLLKNNIHWVKKKKDLNVIIFISISIKKKYKQKFLFGIEWFIIKTKNKIFFFYNGS